MPTLKVYVEAIERIQKLGRRVEQIKWWLDDDDRIRVSGFHHNNFGTYSISALITVDLMVATIKRALEAELVAIDKEVEGISTKYGLYIEPEATP